MIICFEGPEGSGKTTQANLLSDYIKEKYPDKKVKYVKFPDKSRPDISAILSNDSVVINPYFTASAYMNDFYQTLHEVRTDDEGNSYTYSEWAERDDRVLIFDRYYYSSFVMCKGWPNKYDIKQEDFDKFSEEDKANYLQTSKEYIFDLFGTTIRMARSFELNAPDLTFILLPSYDECARRISERKNNNYFDSDKMAKIFYNLYIESLVKNKALYNYNGEKLSPVIIRSENHIYIEHINELSEALDKKIERKSKTPEIIAQEINNIFDSYLDIRNSNKVDDTVVDNDVENMNERIYNILRDMNFNHFATCAIMGNIMKESGMNPRACSNGKNFEYIDTDDTYGYGLLQWTYKNRKENLVKFLYEKNYKQDDPEGQLQFMITELPDDFWRKINDFTTLYGAVKCFHDIYLKSNDNEDQLKERVDYAIKIDIKFTKLNSVSEDNKEESIVPSNINLTTEKKDDDTPTAKEEFNLTDAEFYVYNKLKMTPKDVIEDPERFVLGNDYDHKSRVGSLVTMLKIVTSKTISESYKGKAADVEKYIRGKLESLKLTHLKR